MALQDSYNLETIRNEAAEMVHARVQALLDERPELCHCQTCVLDLVAFMLNRICPRYSASLLGDLHPDRKKEKRMQVEIDLALQAGLKRLQEHPHHC
jgi:competence protein ComFB